MDVTVTSDASAAKLAAEARFNAWWPPGVPFAPTAPWIAAAVTRGMARRWLGRPPSRVGIGATWLARRSFGPPGNSARSAPAGPRAVPSGGAWKSYGGWTLSGKKGGFQYAAIASFLDNGLPKAAADKGFPFDFATSDWPEMRSAVLTVVRDNPHVTEIKIGAWYHYDTDTYWLLFDWGTDDGHWYSSGGGGGSGQTESPGGGESTGSDGQGAGQSEGESYVEVPMTTGANGRTVTGKTSDSATFVSGEEPASVNDSYDPWDTDQDGDVDFCEWLAGVFGCVPPPWIPLAALSPMATDGDSWLTMRELMGSLDVRVKQYSAHWPVAMLRLRVPLVQLWRL